MQMMASESINDLLRYFQIGNQLDVLFSPIHPRVLLEIEEKELLSTSRSLSECN